MSQATELFRQKLKEHGLSETGPRKAIFEALLKSDHEPVTMNKLVLEASQYADRATVYRTVKTLESIDIIKRLNIGWKYKLELSDDFHGHHHHISCIKCGATHAVHNDEYLESTLSQLAERNGYDLTDHMLDMHGICKECRKLKNPAE